jgi:FMN-dependent NADH-azoreductase
MCLILIPVAILYAANFKLILNLKNEVDRNTEKAMGTAVQSEEQQKVRQEQIEKQEAQMNELLSIDNIKNVLRVVGVPIYNMSLVRSHHEGLLPGVCLHD